MQEFPPRSQLDDTETYGAQESAIKAEHIESHLEGLTASKVLENWPIVY